MKITTSIFILTIFLLLSGCTETYEASYHMYYSRFGDSKTGLYRSDLDGQKKNNCWKQISTVYNFHDGWLCAAITSGGSVLKISLNGKKESELITEDGLPISTTNFIIIADWIYFVNRSDEFDMREGLQEKLLTIRQ